MDAVPCWLYLASFVVIVLAVCAGAIILGARKAPPGVPVGTLVLCLLAIFGLDNLSVPPSIDAVMDYVAMAVVLYFLYRSGPMLRDFVRRKFN